MENHQNGYFQIEMVISATENARGVKQGRKSMFKHGGDNIGIKYTSRLRDVSRDTPRFARGVRGHAPPRKFFIWCNLVCFGVYFDQILSLKIF